MFWYWWILIVVLVLAAVAGLAWLAVWLCCMRTRKPLQIVQGKTQAWYGRVNAWAQDSKALKKDVEACANAGVTGYMIEMMGWARYDAWTPKWLKETEEAYELLVKLCRRHGLWLFVSIVNDNMGSRKYGDPGIKLSSVYDKALDLARIVRDNGRDNVIVQPVAETTTDAGRKFEQDCVGILGGKFPLVYNGGSRPGGIPGGWQFRAWHPFKVKDKVPADALAISDTGSIIMQLGVGLDGPAHPFALEDWARRIRAQGCPVAGYYAFKRAGHDAAAIKALGRAIK